MGKSAYQGQGKNAYHLREKVLDIYKLIERRYDASPTLLCTQYPKKDWHQRLGGGVHADAIMDRIVHNAVWYYAGDVNMREHYGKDLGE